MADEGQPGPTKATADYDQNGFKVAKRGQKWGNWAKRWPNAVKIGRKVKGSSTLARSQKWPKVAKSGLKAEEVA